MLVQDTLKGFGLGAGYVELVAGNAISGPVQANIAIKRHSLQKNRSKA